MKRVLVFPAGTEIAFEIFNALKYSKFVELFGGTSVDDHSEFVFKNLIKGIPYITSPVFVSNFNSVIKQYSIDCIFPAHDSVCEFLSEHREEINAQVIISDSKTTKICRSKKDTYRFLDGCDFLPKVYEKTDSIQDFPVFAKPSIGQGSNGAKIIRNRDELDNYLKERDDLVVCEYLPGVEYTVDCFTDRHGELLVIKLRDRERIRAGISVRSKELPVSKEILRIAHTLNERFDFCGAWFFQVKKDNCGKYKLMEISPRIPGTMGLSRNLGINFPMLTLFTFWGYDVAVIDNAYNIVVDRAFYSAYIIDYKYSHIYLDFDDTLILNGKVNSDLMRFIYQAVNQGKKIHILSKHVGNIYEDLKKARICADLFEEIIVIPIDEDKIDYIKERESIFIDDSFAERKRVKDATGIAVFDLDMVESLIDWRA